MKQEKIYITTAAQISMQNPLSEEWYQNPIIPTNSFVRSIEPDYRQVIRPIEARRMGRILKRALTTSLSVIQKSGIEHPEAIITGSGLGCIENTELFLEAMCKDGEHLLKPTPFMQSTHNTISSLIAIYTKTHSYNTTYSHRAISFESALYDAFIQFKLNKIQSALVGSHDEVTPTWYKLLEKIGYIGYPSGEASVSFMLAKQPKDNWCELAGMKILHEPSLGTLKLSLRHLLDDADLSIATIDAVMTGINGNPQNDKSYLRIADELFEGCPLLRYKHLFGESYSASGLGVYVTAYCLKQQMIPDLFYLDSTGRNT